MVSLKHVDVKTARRLQTLEEHTYIDVRSILEYDRGHPEGAHNIPLLHADEASGRMQPNPKFLSVIQANHPVGDKLLIGCQMGGRSAQAGQILVAAGYENVCNVLGGFGGARDRSTGQVINEGWVDAALPVEQNAPKEATYEHLSDQLVKEDN